MKGLFLHNMHATSNNAGIVPPAIKEEAFDYVKRGLKSDLFSATCTSWDEGEEEGAIISARNNSSRETRAHCYYRLARLRLALS